MISIVFYFVSLLFAIPVFNEYFKTGLVPRIPTLLFSGVMLLVALLLNITGIILQVIVKKHRQLFELQLNQICILKNK